jgi:hypothetical protein
MCLSRRPKLVAGAGKLPPVPTLEEAQRNFGEANKPLPPLDLPSLLGVSPAGAAATIAFLLVTLLHAALLYANCTLTEVNLLFFGKHIVNKSTLLGAALLWGLLTSSSLFLWRQWNFDAVITDLRERQAELTVRVAQREYQLARLQTAAKKIAVPYRLDALIDQNLTDFVDYSNGSKSVLRTQAQSGHQVSS